MKSFLNALMIPASAVAFVTHQPRSLSRISRHDDDLSTIRSVAGSDWDNTDDNVPSVDLDLPPPPSKRKEIVMSPAIPFLECPPVLVDCTMAGNVGFDPLGFAKTEEDLMVMRESEIRHARLAMLAAAGWPLSELLDRHIADFFGLDSILDAYDRAPSLLNGGLERVSPIWWGTCLGLTAAIDLDAIAKARSGDPEYFPGNLGFDPLNLFPPDEEGRARMELAEIKHGRLSMIAVAAFALQEYVTSLGVIDETPFFFFPLSESLERMGFV
eukprot:scaffold2476_cov193-Amphora_coffeaeformis.AAC.3